MKRNNVVASPIPLRFSSSYAYKGEQQTQCMMPGYPDGGLPRCNCDLQSEKRCIPTDGVPFCTAGRIQEMGKVILDNPGLLYAHVGACSVLDLDGNFIVFKSNLQYVNECEYSRRRSTEVYTSTHGPRTVHTL